MNKQVNMNDFKTKGKGYYSLIPERTGFYRAIVANNKDLSRLGKVQVRIPSLHGSNNDMPDKSLPWATPGCMLGASYKEGMWIIPKVGDIVICGFEAGDEKSILYFGSLYTNKRGQDPSTGDIDLDDYILYRTPEGDKISVDKTGDTSLGNFVGSIASKVIIVNYGRPKVYLYLPIQTTQNMFLCWVKSITLVQRFQIGQTRHMVFITFLDMPFYHCLLMRIM